LPSPKGSRSASTIAYVVRAAHRAAEIVDSISAINKKEIRSHAPLNLNQLIKEVLALLESELQGHHIAVRTEVLADQVQIQQVMVNLIENAIEAMSFVTGRSRVLHLKTEFDGARNILVTIEDSGLGIDPNNVERIFDRFFTTKAQGMGMGLAICRSIIEAHNGRLWAEARGDQGSIFRMSLPVAYP
jgi:signal transduction histidine kinase